LFQTPELGCRLTDLENADAGQKAYDLDTVKYLFYKDILSFIDIQRLENIEKID